MKTDKDLNNKQPKRGFGRLFVELAEKILKISSPKVNVLLLKGIIGGSSSMKPGLALDGLNEHIEAAFKTKGLSAVVLSINSPGGSPVQSELIYNRIRELAKKNDIKVISFAEDVAASGGYWLSVAGDEIFASSSSIIGSIGVISASFGFDKTIKKLGIDRRVYTSGKNKSILDPFQPIKDSDISIIKNIQEDIHNNFIDAIKKRREKKLTKKDEKIFTGEFWTGTKALELGLIDGIGSLHSVLEEKFGKDINIKIINPEKSSWFKRKMGLVVEIFTESAIEVIYNKIEQKTYLEKFNIK